MTRPLVSVEFVGTAWDIFDGRRAVVYAWNQRLQYYLLRDVATGHRFRATREMLLKHATQTLIQPGQTWVHARVDNAVVEIVAPIGRDWLVTNDADPATIWALVDEGFLLRNYAFVWEDD